MIKLFMGISFLIVLFSYEGISTYTDVNTLSDLGSLLNYYLTAMTSIILTAFGLDDILHK